MKSKIDQCSSAKRLWKKLHNFCSKTNVGQDEDNNDDCDLDEVDEEEEAVVDMEEKLIITLCDLKKAWK